MFNFQVAHNKANAHGQQKASLVPRSAFLLPVICDVMRPK
jgi:hypothetical protein